jgi:hypothetical protein
MMFHVKQTGNTPMSDYRDEHSPDIALLLALARIVRRRHASDMTATELAELDEALKPFEAYPDPVTDD